MHHMPWLYQYPSLPFHRSWNDRSHAMDISRITKVKLKNCQKIEKNDPFNLKNGIFKKNNQKSIFSNDNRSSRPKYHIPMWKTYPVALKLKFTSVIWREKRKMLINSLKMKISNSPLKVVMIEMYELPAYLHEVLSHEVCTIFYTWSV